jgi:hypothetical protein
LAYAESRTEANRERLITAFDAAATGQTRMLTMGAYWVRPETYTAFGGVNVNLFANKYGDVAAQLNLEGKISGEDFLANTETVSAWLSSRDSPFDMPPELSLSAWHFHAISDAPQAPADDITAAADVESADDGPEATVREVASEYVVADIVAYGSFLDIQLLESNDRGREVEEEHHLARATRNRQDVARPTPWLGAVQRASFRPDDPPAVSPVDVLRRLRPWVPARLRRQTHPDRRPSAHRRPERPPRLPNTTTSWSSRRSTAAIPHRSSARCSPCSNTTSATPRTR